MYRQLQNEIILLQELEKINEKELTEVERDLIETTFLEQHTQSLEQIEKTMGFLSFLDSQTKRLKTEMDRMRSQKQWADKLNKKIKAMIADYLQEIGKKTINVGSYKLSLRKSTSVEVIDESRLPDSCLVRTVTVKPSLSKIKAEIKAGEEIEGAKIVEKENLQIK